MSDREFLDYSGLGYYTDKYNDQVNNITGAEYDSTATYSIDDYCIHDNKVYKCIASIDTAEEWTEEHWTHVNITDEIDRMDHNVDLITNTEKTYGPSSIVTFESETDGAPIRKITADINPVQDLHGYSNPWPAGGGANIWDEVWELGTIGLSTGVNVDANDKIRSKNYVPIQENTSYYFKMPLNWRMVYYDENKNVLEQGNTYSPNIVLQSPSGAHYLRFVIDGITTYGNNASINYPATVTTYSPYSNICPISGHTGEEIEQTGANIWDEEWINGYYSSGVFYSNQSTICSKNFIRVEPNRTYYIHSGSLNVSVCFYDAEKNYITGDGGYHKQNSTFITPNNCYYIHWWTDFGSASTYNNDISINYPATDTAYHPYTGNQISVNWEDEAGTVYGGTVTLNEDGSADVVAEFAKRTITAVSGAFGATNNGYAYYVPFVGTNHNIPYAKQSNMRSNRFKYYPTSRGDAPLYSYGGTDGADTTLFFILPSTITTIADANTWFTSNPTDITVRLTTPLSYHFDNIGQLQTFLGTNNIFTNLNGDTTVTVGKYLSTITSYIDGTKSAILSLIAKDESSGIASTNYVANQFITMNGKFYRITTNVASGATFVIGTNCVETTVGSQITALLNA